MHLVCSAKPYWVAAPPYTHASSGVRVLYKLMDGLLERGHKISLDPDSIVIYPDVTRGNPLRAKNVVRYLLAPAGKYGGSVNFPRTDMVWGYSRSLSENVLHIPVSDPDIFYPPSVENAPRQNECFYSHKYELHGNKIKPEYAYQHRLEGSLSEIADRLRKSTRCYIYELSSVIHEAALCGCPVTLMRTLYFNHYDSDTGLVLGDITWSDGEKICGTTLGDTHNIYKWSEREYQKQLDNFIHKTQENFA